MSELTFKAETENQETQLEFERIDGDILVTLEETTRQGEDAEDVGIAFWLTPENAARLRLWLDRQYGDMDR